MDSLESYEHVYFMHFVILLIKVDMHSVHFHGQILTAQNHHTDTISLFPGSSATAEMTADNVGHWLLTCTVNDHLMGKLTYKQMLMFRCQTHYICPIAGQVMHFSNVFWFVQLECKPYLRSKNASPMYINHGLMASSDSSSLLLRRESGTMRLHHLMMGLFMCMHILFTKFRNILGNKCDLYFLHGCREADVFLTRGRNRIGSRYKKVHYVEYTDNTFMTKILRTPEELHLGILGKSKKATNLSLK